MTITKEGVRMRKDVIIHIDGKPKYDGVDGEEIELTTSGRLYRKNGNYFIMYKESELTGMEGSTTTLKIENERITMMRNGTYPSHMVFEKGKKHVGVFNTETGAMTVSISARDIYNKIDDDGGELTIDYAIEVDYMLTGENLFHIDVEAPKTVLS